MRKGLTTLLTVAIAMIGSQAMAMAPTIGDIPSPVIGGQLATQTTKFVYPDAFNLDLLVSDDQTTPTNLLKWTYEEVGSTYVINGFKPIVSSTTDPITVAANLTINQTGLAQTRGKSYLNTTVESGFAGNLAHVTIRNERCWPLGGTMLTGQTGWTDINPVTFWCSDGNAVSSSTIMFYTDNTGGINRLSAKVVNWVPGPKQMFVGSSNWSVSEGFFGTCTTHTWPASGTGVCFEVAKTGNNWGSVASPMPFITLSANTLYRIRAKMNCSQIAPGHTPFWDFIIENSYDPVAKTGLNLYSTDQIFLDNVGGANAVVSSLAGTDLVMYFAPTAVSTAQMQTKLFVPAYTGQKDARLRFRVLDVDSNTALLNDQKYGAICLMSVQVDSLPMSKVTVNPTPIVSITSFKRNTDTTNVTLNNTEVSGFVGPSIVFASGALTVTPAGGGISSELVTITPSNGVNTSGGASPVFTSPYTNMASTWPIPWTSNKIYELDVTVVAPTSNDMAHPWDAMWMNIDCPTNEVNCESVITSVKGLCSPTTVAATYKLFFNTMNETVISQAAFHYLRWRIRFGNNTSLNFPNASDVTNTGSARLTGLKVSTVTVPAS